MKEQKQNGYITLVLIIIVGALTSAVVLTALSDGISSAQTGLSFSQTYKARGYANACKLYIEFIMAILLRQKIMKMILHLLEVTQTALMTLLFQARMLQYMRPALQIEQL